MSSPARRALVAGATLALAGSLAGASTVTARFVEEPAEEKRARRSLRELPGLAEAWRCDCGPRAVEVADGVVHVLARHRLFALDAADRTLLWDLDLGADQAGFGSRLLVLGERVAADLGDAVVLADRATGVEIARLELGGRVEALVGPPLAVLRQLPDGGGAEVVRLDPASGHDLARRGFPGHPGLAALDGRLWVAVHGEGDRPRLLELDGGTLDTLGEWEAPGTRILAAADGRLRFAERHLDPRPLPEENRGGGFRLATFDPERREWSEPVEVAGPGADPTEEPGLARTSPASWTPSARGLLGYDPASGEVAWATELPCRPGPILRDGEELVVACGWHAGGGGLLLVLEAATGEVRERLHGPARVQSIQAAGERWIVSTYRAVLAVERRRRAEPLALSEPIDLAVERIVGEICGTIPIVSSDDVEELLMLGPAAAPRMAELLPESRLRVALTLADALAELGHREAAPAIAGRLERLPTLDERGDWPGEARVHPPERVLLRALGRIGDGRQAPAVGRVLLDAAQPWRVRQEAAFALAGLGDPAALAWLDRLDRRRAGGVDDAGADDAGADNTGADDGGRAATPHADGGGNRSAATPPPGIDAVILRHAARFGEGDGPEPQCAAAGDGGDLPASAESDGSCVELRIHRLADFDGAEEATAGLPLEQGDRRRILVRHRRWTGGGEVRCSRDRDVVGVRRVGERWVVRSVDRWVSGAFSACGSAPR